MTKLDKGLVQHILEKMPGEDFVGKTKSLAEYYDVQDQLVLDVERELVDTDQYIAALERAIEQKETAQREESERNNLEKAVESPGEVTTAMANTPSGESSLEASLQGEISLVPMENVERSIGATRVLYTMGKDTLVKATKGVGRGLYVAASSTGKFFSHAAIGMLPYAMQEKIAQRYGGNARNYSLKSAIVETIVTIPGSFALPYTMYPGSSRQKVALAIGASLMAGSLSVMRILVSESYNEQKTDEQKPFGFYAVVAPVRAVQYIGRLGKRMGRFFKDWYQSTKGELRTAQEKNTLPPVEESEKKPLGE